MVTLNTFLMVTLVENIYQLRQSIQDFVSLKVTEQVICEVVTNLGGKFGNLGVFLHAP